MIRITYRTSQGELVSRMYDRSIEAVARGVLLRAGHTILRTEQVGA